MKIQFKPNRIITVFKGVDPETGLSFTFPIEGIYPISDSLGKVLTEAHPDILSEAPEESEVKQPIVSGTPKKTAPKKAVARKSE
jgi:hypothetical protein